MGIQTHNTRTIHAALAPTWIAVSEMNAVRNWHPNVAEVELLSPNNAGEGASRRVIFQDGNSVVETILSEAEETFVTMELAGASMIADAAVTIRLEPKSSEETQVTFSIDYSVQYGPIGWLLGQLMFKRAFKQVFGVSLSGLAYHLETGNLVDDSIPAR